MKPCSEGFRGLRGYPPGFEPRITPPKGAVLPEESDLFDELLTNNSFPLRRLASDEFAGSSPNLSAAGLVFASCAIAESSFACDNVVDL
jgi:hypothetical protein